MKRLWPCLLFLFNSEVLSIIALLIYVGMLLMTIVTAAERKKNGY